MSLKGKGMMLMLATMAMGGMGGMPTPYQEPVKRKRKEDYKPFDVDLIEIPKGHVADHINFEYERGEFKFKASIQFSYTNSKTKIKRSNSRGKEAQQYINQTPHELLIEFNQFEIEQIQPITETKD